MQPRNGEETKYFFIVSQYSRGRLVLDIKNGKKSGILEIVEPERGRSSQLWRWDESCRLVSKLGLVADQTSKVQVRRKKPSVTPGKLTKA